MSKPAEEVSSDPLLLAAPLVEGYRVLEPAVLYGRVGTGSMGAVYRGRHLSLHCDVAVKVLKPDFAQDETFVARFEREAQLAVRLGNDNVVRVFDVREKNGIHYLVMEFVRGETARERVQRKGPLSEGEALAILVGACRGMRAAHAAGIVHRDIKPDNVLISSDGAVKVADLGLAKGRPAGGEHSDASLSSCIMGTPQFMPPEQWLSPDVTPAADVWSLGASLWYLLVGRNAIEGGVEFVVGQRIRDHDFPRLLEARPDVRPAVARVVAKCTQRDPRERFADAGELLRALQPLAPAGDDVLADPATGTGKLRMATLTPPPRSALAKIKSQITTVQVSSGVAANAQSGPRPGAETPAFVQDVGGAWWRRRRLRLLAGAVLAAGLASVIWLSIDAPRPDPSPSPSPSPPPSPVTHPSRVALQRGLAALAGGNVETAIAAFEEALQLEPGLADARAKLVLALTRCAEQLAGSDPDAAYERLARAQQLAPDDAPVRDVRQRVVAALQKRLADGLSLVEPAANSVCRERGVQVRVSATAPKLGRVLLAVDARDGAASMPFPRERCDTVAIVDGQFEGRVTAPADGHLVVRLAAEDTHGFFAEGPMRPVVVDTVDPVVAIDSPADAAEVSAKVRLAGRATDATLDVVTVAGQRVPVASDGSWSVELDMAAGEQEIVVVARDRAGRETRTVRNLRVDATPPVLTWLAPAETTVAPGELTVSLTATDAVDVSIKVAEKNANTERDGATWSATVLVGVGECIVSVTARDAAGNTAELSRTLRVAELSPVSAWATPVPGAASVVVDGTTYPRVVVEKRTGMRMVLVDACPDGFDMGSPDDEAKRDPEEVRHRRVIRRAFWLGQTEVTQAQWLKIMESNPSRFGGDDRPVERVTWADCQQFIQRLNEQGRGFRLPSEVEWEYACRAGGSSPFNTGKDITTNEANYDGNLPYAGAKGQYRASTVPAGSLPANALGFHEMHGNVREWCQDAHAPYPGTGDERAVARPGADRVMRGGYWGAPAECCRSASRARVGPEDLVSYNGFRLARTLQ